LDWPKVYVWRDSTDINPSADVRHADNRDGNGSTSTYGSDITGEAFLCRRKPTTTLFRCRLEICTSVSKSLETSLLTPDKGDSTIRSALPYVGAVQTKTTTY